MTRSRDGGGKTVRRRWSSHAISDPDIYHSDVGNSEGDSRSSGNDMSFLDLEFKIRDTVLDDALFGFFRKQD